MPSPHLKPINKFLGPLGKPEEGGYSLEDAIALGEPVRELLEHPGWKVLNDAIEMVLRDEQARLMYEPPKPEQNYERLIGIWTGMKKVPAIAAGIVRYADEAEARLRGVEKQGD